MTPTTSFAPLAGRLAARAAEIRPADGAEVSWANFMALFFCAIFEMLIALCEALDARAAADARLLASPALRDGAAGAALATRSKRSAMLGAARAPRLALVPNVQDTSPTRNDDGCRMAEPTPAIPSRSGAPYSSPDETALGLHWRRHRETRAFALEFSTPILLLYGNK